MPPESARGLWLGGFQEKLLTLKNNSMNELYSKLNFASSSFSVVKRNRANEKINQLFAKYRGFFAFSQEQFEEAKKKDIKYVSRGGGLFHEWGKSKEFDEDYKLIITKAIAQDLKENGKEAIIERELSNHECYFSYDVSDAVEKLKEYGITYDEIRAEFEKNKSKHYED